LRYVEVRLGEARTGQRRGGNPLQLVAVAGRALGGVDRVAALDLCQRVGRLAGTRDLRGARRRWDGGERRLAIGAVDGGPGCIELVGEYVAALGRRQVRRLLRARLADDDGQVLLAVDEVRGQGRDDRRAGVGL